MPATDHSDHLTGPQPAAPVLPIAELFAADLLPPRVPQSRSLARTAQRRLDELAARQPIWPTPPIKPAPS